MPNILDRARRQYAEQFMRQRMAELGIQPLTPEQISRGEGLGGWEGRRQQEIDIGMNRYGLSSFLPGGRYAGENLPGLFNKLYGSNVPMLSPFLTVAPSVGAAQRYGYGAMDLAGRAAGLQTGIAARGVSDLPPAARAAALAQIAQGGASQLGSAGVSGYGMGLQELQRAALANQEARMTAAAANQAALLGEREAMRGLFGTGIGLTAGAGQYGAGQHIQALLDYWNQRNQRAAQQEAATGAAIGGLFGGIGSYLGSRQRG